MGKLDMISAARLSVLITACSILLIASASQEPAIAQAGACKAEVVTVAGRPKIRPWNKRKELEGDGAAMDDAVAKWQREVGAKYGEQWEMWSRAKDTTFSCAPTGKITGSIACTISGRPCATAASAATTTPSRGKAAAEGDRGRRKTSDEDRRVGERRWPGSAAYEREMARQQEMAAARDRAEAAAWEREMARQNEMAAARERTEARRRKVEDDD
jgi:hypothetical protein